MGIKVLSLYDGIACGRAALERADFAVDEYVAYEIEDSAIKIATYNFPDIKEKGDVFKAGFSVYSDFNLLIGGSPCTYWSICQKPEKREITNSGLGWDLFSQYVRALKESGIKFFLYENNYSMDKQIKEEITKAFNNILRERGEKEIEPICINSALVSAQNRKRLYWTNIPCNGESYLPTDKNIKLKDILEFGYTDREKPLCLIRRYSGFAGTDSYLCRRYFGKHMGQAVFQSKEAYDELNALWKANPYFDKGIKSEADIKKRKIRRLTLTEIERLQTLPDGYTGNVSDVNELKKIEAIGNGWTVDVIAYLLSGFRRKINA